MIWRNLVYLLEIGVFGCWVMCLMLRVLVGYVLVWTELVLARKLRAVATREERRLLPGAPAPIRQFF